MKSTLNPDEPNVLPRLHEIADTRGGLKPNAQFGVSGVAARIIAVENVLARLPEAGAAPDLFDGLVADRGDAIHVGAGRDHSDGEW